MTTKDFSIDLYSDNLIRFVAFNSRLANKLNKTLKVYLNEKGDAHTIQDGEEPIFLISEANIAVVSTLLPYGYDKGYVKQKMSEMLTSGAI